MIANKLTIQNFMGIGSGTLHFNKPGLTLIEGINTSSPTSKSNGASKSSIYEAMHWCLWGTTKRGLKGNDVVNDEAGKDCRVTFEFDDITVVRTRKDTKEKNSLRVWRDKEEITKGTIPDTEILIEQLVGVSEGTFAKIAHFGQGDVKQFPALTDREFKKVFEEALGLTFFSDDLTVIKEERKRISDELGDLVHEEQRLIEGRIVGLGQCVENTHKTIIAWDESHRSRIQTTTEGISNSERSISTLTESLGAYPEAPADYRERLKMVDGKIDNLNELHKKLREQINRHNRQLADANHRVTFERIQERQLSDELRTIGKKVGEACHTCGRSFTTGDIDALSHQTERNLESVQTRLDDAEERHKRILDEGNRLEELQRQLIDQTEVAQKEKNELVQSSSGLNTRETILKQIDGLKKLLKSSISALEKIKTEKNPHLATLKAQKADLEDAKHALSIVRSDKKPLEERLALVELLEEVFGNAGLKSYVFDSVTPELNKLIHKNISMLDDIEIEVSTIKHTKSGEAREKFSIAVKNEHGASVFAGNSGGEKQKINIALSLAFNALVRSMAAQPLNFIFLDEVFESLDSGSAEPVVDLCKQLATEVPNVHIITHQPHIKELVDQTLTVTKTGKKATFIH